MIRYNAGKGNDLIYADDTNDYFDGGSGVDTLDFSHVTLVTPKQLYPYDMTISLNDDGSGSYTKYGAIQIFPGTYIPTVLQHGSFDGIENINGSNLRDYITGNSSANSIHGNAGDDIILGNGGNDKIAGDDGNDIIYGGDGNDSISGGTGNDTINGGLGNDTINGGSGIDTFDFSDMNGPTGSAGFDVSIGMGTHLYSSYTAYQSETDLSAGTHTTFGVYGETDTLTSMENVTGSALNDYIWGTGGANVINGGAGFDTIRAGDGNDTIISSGNGGFAMGESGNDIIDYTANTGYALISGGAGNDIIKGGAGDDTMEGDSGLFGNGFSGTYSTDTGSDKLYGNGGNDVLYGGLGNDLSDGGDGNDFIWDYSGNNTLTGGAGNDTFYFCTENGSYGAWLDTNPTYYFKDHITDFTQGQDHIQIGYQYATQDNPIVTISYSGANTIVQLDENHKFIVDNVHLTDSDFIFG